MYRVKETFEYFVNDPNNFCSVHDALEMDTSMPCPCWDGSKVPVNEKGEEKSIPWGNSKVSITDIGNTVKIDKDTLLKLIKNSEKLSTLEEWGVDNWINYGEEELQRYIKNARQFFKTTAKNEENFYFSNSYGVLNVL
ncbi:MAG: hypothetical protein [Bacteriophage sp.]|nr:MAG: hypothetical protein [Bacteriophage sp.]